MRSIVFKFIALIVASAAILAVGLLIALLPDTYQRWVHWSKAERYAPSFLEGWDVYSRRSRMIGVSMAVFGIVAVILSVWICWFQ